MISPSLVVAVIAMALCAPAQAATIAIGDVHSEPDVADEAGAVTLLVRSALAETRSTLVALPPKLTIASAPAMLAKAKADHGVVLELAREGTGLRVTLAIVAAGGTTDVSFVRAGDGDVRVLAQGVVDRVATTVGFDKVSVPELALGSLRPHAAALRLHATSADEAALALTDATPETALAASAAANLLGDVPSKVTTPVLAVLSARALRDTTKLDALGASADPVAIAAKAFAALARGTMREAEAALGAKPPRDGLVALAHAVMAASRSDNQALGKRLEEALTTDQPRAVLALASTIVAARSSPTTHKLLVAFAEKFPSPGVGSRIGLNAAELGVEMPRALALISARELDDYDLKRLDALIGKAVDATAWRLRAELAMRKADGTESAMIAEYLRVAPDDLRAHRYQGWLLAGQGKYIEAAAAFEKAQSPRERARALLAANEVQAARAAIGDVPVTAEDHVIAMRVALLDKRVDVAVSTIALAERMAPVNPIVHQAILVLDAVQPDPKRAAISRLVVEKGSAEGEAQLARVGSAGASVAVTAIGSGDRGSGERGSGAQVLVETMPELTSLEPVVAALPGLQELPARRIALVEMQWEPKLWSFRTTRPERIRAALTMLLARPPYRLQVIGAAAVPDQVLRPQVLAKLTINAEAVLVYRLAAIDGEPHISLVFYQRNASEAAQATQTLKQPGLVVFDDGKLKVVLVFGGLFVLAIAIALARARGRIRVEIVRAPDVTDEVLCVEITKGPSRPQVGDPVEFARTTRKVGVLTKPRLATLITSGQTFKVPIGKWYVHLYGAFARSGQMRAVPASCTQQLHVKRGQLVEAKFDLTSKFAELHVEVVAEQLRGMTVWANDAVHDKAQTDAQGIAVLALPVGTHTIHIDAHGQRFERQVQIVAPKLERLSFNVERERRMAEGIAIDLPPDPEVLEVQTPIVKLRRPGTPSAELVEHVLVPSSDSKQASAIASAATAYSDSLSVAMRAFPRASTPKPGDKLLDRYRLIAELGRGAMGVVHRAWDEKLERAVAIKEMADALRSDAEAMRLFTQEAKALAQLNHTNIVAMYDQITDASGVYMIMEFVDGQPLQAIVEARHALPWREAVGIIDQVCSGLAYAHARKVIHRDIKPANIFVARDRTVKLGDFGLARVMREVTIRRTEVRGTPLYMAPEQITGTDVDHRADLYAVGCTLFEMICGRPPFIEGDVLYAHMHTPPPAASTFTAGLPRVLEQLLVSLLAKAAADRPGSANDVRTALRELFPR